VNILMSLSTEGGRFLYQLNEYNTIIDFLDITHPPAFLFKSNVSETELCLRPQVKTYSVGPNR
jgi:hypothetical protein